MTPLENPDEWRADSRESWESGAPAWGAAADDFQNWAVEVSATMVDALALQPGDRVLELAAGPADTGFMAAELIRPGGTLICSDGAEAMLEVARARAAAQHVDNVEFRQLELEWIDLETASVDAVLCRYGIMLVVDPAAAAREIRRILRPGGRAALAVWDLAERNPWATIPREAAQALELTPAPDPDAPNQFSLAADGALAELLQDAGLVDVKVAPVAMTRHFSSVDAYIAETAELMGALRRGLAGADEIDRDGFRERVADAARPFTDADGALELPGSTLVASAAA
jgi:SAM-dependent methyltransferase